MNDSIVPKKVQEIHKQAPQILYGSYKTNLTVCDLTTE